METTINVSKKQLEYMLELSTKSKLSMREIVLFVIAKSAKNEPFLEKKGSNVSYQEADGDWHKLHLEFSPQECERNAVLRLLFKLSFSLIVSLSLELYGDDLLKKEETTQSEILTQLTDIYQQTEQFCFTMGDKNRRIFGYMWERRKKKKRGVKRREKSKQET